MYLTTKLDYKQNVQNKAIILVGLQEALENLTLELNESASDDMEDASDTEDEDARWKSRRESIGAEVKEDSDYHP